MTTIEQFLSNAPSADTAEDVIFEAATDGKSQLRYLVGDDAIALEEKRRTMTDEAYLKEIRQMFGL